VDLTAAGSLGSWGWHALDQWPELSRLGNGALSGSVSLAKVPKYQILSQKNGFLVTPDSIFLFKGSHGRPGSGKCGAWAENPEERRPEALLLETPWSARLLLDITLRPGPSLQGPGSVCSSAGLVAGAFLPAPVRCLW
jgi:hypothetical protein